VTSSDTAGPAAEPDQADEGDSAQGSAGNGGANAPEGGATGATASAPTPPAASFTDSPPVVPARLQGLDLGPACNQCGGMMQRTGSCYTCSSCGNNTGCG